MARLEIKDLDYLARARRVVRRSGSYTLTVRYGKVYTYKVSRQNQPNSKEQKRQRGIFARANEIVAKELKREERLEYWRKEAEKSGKKTARGAAMAYWCMRLKSENVNNTHFNYHIKKWKTEDCLSIDGRYNEILSRNIWIGRVNRLILQSLSKGKVAGGGISEAGEGLKMLMAREAG